MLLQGLFLHAGKALTEPLFVLTAGTVVALVVALRRAKQKRPLAFALAAVLILALLSTDIAADAIFASLAVKPVTGTPDVIVVASGGFRDGVTPDLDVLKTETESRVATGIRAWRQHPTARLVMAGTAEPSSPRAARMVEIMRDHAICAGVPPSAILLDPRSTNTREHADRLAEMPGIDRNTRVGIATSHYHMRRALHVFRRRFATVLAYPTQPRQHTRQIDDFLPHVDALERSTDGIHEWIGLAWYAGHDALEDITSALRRSRGLQR